VTLDPGDRLGAHQIADRLGEGGMGIVYRATDLRLKRNVAIKVLPAAFTADPARVARFEREAQLLASLNHSNIAQVYGFEHALLPDGSAGHYLAMELVEGEDLEERLGRGPIPVDEAISIAKQIADALEEAHEHGIIHRDLKPGNIKVTPEGRVKVLDFGLAKAHAGAAAASSAVDLAQSPTMAQSATQAGLILGTAAYMSPEQARGRPADKRADIWAFGVVFFEMLTGQQVFRGETVSDSLAATLGGDIDWNKLPYGTPAHVRQLLARCLERDPRSRLRDIGEARVALDTPAATSGAARREGAAVSRNRAGIRAIWPMLPGIALAAVAVAGWTWWRAAPSTSREVVHLDIVFPTDVEPVSGRQGGIAITPDGRAVAMVGFKDGQRRLFVRRLDTPEAMDVSGTSGAGVFSPDGRHVAFISNATALTRFSLADRQSSILATGGDFVTGVSLAWSPTTVFFVRGGSLWAVPPDGGEARQLTTLDAAQGEVLHIDPLPLPGGQHVLFSCLTAAAGAGRIESVPVGGGARAIVVENATTPVWSTTGHLLFGRDGAVWAMPFDPDTARGRGPAVVVIPAGFVGTVRTGSLGFQLSANGTLVFVPVNFDSKRLVSVARDGAELPLALPPGSYGNPRMSTDGRRIGFEREGSVVETVDLVRGTRAVVVPSAVGTNFPLWTADGTRLVFRRNNVPFWAAADGSGKSGVVPNSDPNTSPGSAGPDADTIIAVRLLPETGGDLYLVSLSGAFAARPLVATPAYEGSPHLSPDKRWLLYQSNATGQPEVYVRRYPDLDRAWQVSEGGGVQARWDPSGREIYYRGNRQMMSVAFDPSGSELALGKPRALFADVYDFGQGLSIPNYDVTPDGRFIMLRRGTQGGTLRVVLNWAEELKRTLATGGAQ
jgi:Tol biopolymer transport system component